MKKLLPIVMVAILFLAGCAVGTTQGQEPVLTTVSGSSDASQPSGLVVSGEGLVSYVPDVAILSLGIESQETTVAQAQANAADAMNKVVAALKAKGVADKDITTQRFSIQPVTQWVEEDVSGLKRGRQVIIGYQVTNTVQAKLRQIDQAGPVIDAVAAAGGDLTRINSISFTKEDITQEKNTARAAALQDAKAKAQQMAGILGITLGKPIYITESSPYITPTRDYYGVAPAAAESAPTPVLPGEQQLTVTVQIVYGIQ
jgi:uncharacterized protein YggE